MDRSRGIKNVTVSIAFRVLILIADVLVRRFLIQYIGNAVNGINSLYLSILNFLSVAELGVGSAITFCMYKPIVDGDRDKVSALYGLFTKLYLIIGAIITVGGCAVMPALRFLAKDYQTANVNLYSTFALMLASVVLTYMFSSKTSLINAYKNNYITTAISSLGTLLKCGLQVVIIIYTKSFVWYLACRIIAVVIQWGATEIVARFKHKDIMSNKQRVDDVTKKEVTKNVKAMFMHKIGAVLVNTADSIIISAFIGIVVLGKYSNYITIMSSMTGILMLCFSPLTSVIGHMFVEENKDTARKYHSFFHTFNFIIAAVFFLGYYGIIDDLVTLLFGRGLEMNKAIVFVITLNYFIQFMRQSTLLFRDATGTFYNDRWKPLAEGLINIFLSVLFVKVFPEQYNVVGVIVATILTNIFICHIVEPHVLYKYAFGSDAKVYYLRNYLYIAVFAAALTALHFCSVDLTNRWLDLLANGFIAVAVAVVPCCAAAVINKDFRHYIAVVGKRIGSKFGLRGKASSEIRRADAVAAVKDDLYSDGTETHAAFEKVSDTDTSQNEHEKDNEFTEN